MCAKQSWWYSVTHDRNQISVNHDASSCDIHVMKPCHVIFDRLGSSVLKLELSGSEPNTYRTFNWFWLWLGLSLLATLRSACSTLLYFLWYKSLSIPFPICLVPWIQHNWYSMQWSCRTWNSSQSIFDTSGRTRPLHLFTRTSWERAGGFTRFITWVNLALAFVYNLYRVYISILLTIGWLLLFSLLIRVAHHLVLPIECLHVCACNWASMCR